MKFEEVQFATGTYDRVTRREAYGMLLTRCYIYMQDSIQLQLSDGILS